jgi:serine/threonine protein kinase
LADSSEQGALITKGKVGRPSSLYLDTLGERAIRELHHSKDYSMHYLTRSRCRCEAGLKFTAAGRKYKFHGSLGNGAVGLVRKAEDVETGRIVAVKLLAPDPKYIDVGAFEDVEQRFKREGLRVLTSRTKTSLRISRTKRTKTDTASPMARYATHLL